MLGVNDHQLLKYLKNKVAPFMNGEAKDSKSPITMIFSVLALVQGCYEKLKAVSIAEAVETPKSEMDLNEQYETLFYMVHWLC